MWRSLTGAPIGEEGFVMRTFWNRRLNTVPAIGSLRLLVNLSGVFIFGTACLGLTACDQVREQVAILLQEKSPQKALDSASKAFDDGQFHKAIHLSESHVRQRGEYQYSFALIVARSYAMLGDADKAVQFLQVAESVRQINRVGLMNDPAFSGIGTTMQFVQFVASGSESTQQPVNGSNLPSEQGGVSASAGGDVSVQIGPGSTAARAGNVSVRISQ